MLGFKLRITGVGSARSANCATITVSFVSKSACSRAMLDSHLFPFELSTLATFEVGQLLGGSYWHGYRCWFVANGLGLIRPPT